jgi:predicted O-methyltransferase YrrM
MYKFDHNWFEQNVENFQKLFSGYKGEPKLKVLEIGSFEGRSAAWFLDNVKDCEVTCVDTWSGSREHEGNPEIDFVKAESNFDHNMTFHRGRVTKIQADSYDACMELYKRGEKFDLIFIDGSHTAKDVNCDLVTSWRLGKIGTLFYCDDYFWGYDMYKQNSPTFNFLLDTPKLGIDSFTNVYANKIKFMEGTYSTHAIFMKVAE